MRKLFYAYQVLIHSLLLYLLIKITPHHLKQEQELLPLNTQKQTGEPPISENKPFNRVTVLPHPPNFLVGREVLFRSYRTIVEEGKIKLSSMNLKMVNSLKPK